MALAHIPLPSFTLVLTSDPQSFHGYPTVIKSESFSSPAMHPNARDHLMQTIDLHGEPQDSIQNPLNQSTARIDYGRLPIQTTLEEEEPSTVHKKRAAGITKQYVLILLQSLRLKLFSAKGTIPV